ncbi:heterodimeric geranylgeranyl pyrophosphate synthase large subunit 1 chloroplastic [Phtheirospermum japonicum]|uniref:Heterodimeric geranylgeranyl pyrophosphate synthase large subunit 1 chloroplastic n=1 Tax=Phtheirospermum japonicum TaxID=374723 RepID=A0A830BBJ3_9LAMI|nr:heterodimeric geranylgeranyl pyrophosphate synthase large subunit 1 chloroplastic [Phtheirospermum japonicum]
MPSACALEMIHAMCPDAPTIYPVWTNDDLRRGQAGRGQRRLWRGPVTVLAGIRAPGRRVRAHIAAETRGVPPERTVSRCWRTSAADRAGGGGRRPGRRSGVQRAWRGERRSGWSSWSTSTCTRRRRPWRHRRWRGRFLGGACDRLVAADEAAGGQADDWAYAFAPREE